MKIKNLEQILERQGTHIRFEKGKVKYFSVSTQHGETDTLDEAIEIIVKADKKYNGKSSFRYFVEKLLEEKLEKEHKENGMQI